MCAGPETRTVRRAGDSDCSRGRRLGLSAGPDTRTVRGAGDFNVQGVAESQLLPVVKLKKPGRTRDESASDGPGSMGRGGASLRLTRRPGGRAGGTSLGLVTVRAAPAAQPGRVKVTPAVLVLSPGPAANVQTAPSP